MDSGIHSRDVVYTINTTNASGLVVAMSKTISSIPSYLESKHLSAGKALWLSGRVSDAGEKIVSKDGIDIIEGSNLFIRPEFKARAFLDTFHDATQGAKLSILSDWYLYADSSKYYGVDESEQTEAILGAFGSRNMKHSIFFYDTPGALYQPDLAPSTKEILSRIPDHVNIIVASLSMMENFKGYFPNKKIYEMPPLVFEAVKDEELMEEGLRSRIRKEVFEMYGLEKDSILILQPTRITGSKGIGKAISLSRQIEKRLGRTVNLVVAGEYNDEFKQREVERLKEFAQSIGYEHAIFPNGFDTSRIAMIYKASDLVTFMTQREGYGLPVGNAAMYGIPLVTTDYTDFSGRTHVFRGVYNNHDAFGNFQGIRAVIDSGAGETIDEKTIEDSIELIQNKKYRMEMVMHNLDAIRELNRYNHKTFHDSIDKLFELQ